MNLSSRNLIGYTALGLLVGGFVLQETHAVQITGGIGISGAYTPQDSSAATVTNLTSATRIAFGGAIVVNSSGALSMPFLTPVAMTSALTFDPFSGPVNSFWSSGGFTFRLDSLTEAPGTSSSSLTLNGSGLISGNGYDPTTGSWVATFNSQGTGTFSWSSSNSATAYYAATGVPDGGTTALLLGGCILGAIVLHRRSKRLRQFC